MLINKQLAGINSRWAVGSKLLIENYNNMEKALEKAQKHTIQVHTSTLYLESRIEFSIEQFIIVFEGPVL